MNNIQIEEDFHPISKLIKDNKFVIEIPERVSEALNRINREETLTGLDTIIRKIKYNNH